jgi:hypothetical protein
LCVFAILGRFVLGEDETMIMAGVETLISTATKIAKKEEQDGRRRIEPVGVQPDDTSKQFEAEDQDARRRWHGSRC